MLTIDLLFIALFTLLLVSLLVPVGGYRTRDAEAGIGITMLLFFLILFPLIWASSAWVGPYGPMMMGVSWVPIIIAGLLLGLMVAAMAPVRPRSGAKAKEDEKEAKAAAGAVGVFVLILFIVAIGLAATTYFI